VTYLTDDKILSVDYAATKLFDPAAETLIIRF